MVTDKKLSQTGKRWTRHEPVGEQVYGKFPELPKPLIQLLHNRGLDTDEAVGAFLNPVYTRDLHSPRLLSGMDAAVGTIYGVIKEGKKIVVHGDYDADGLTSTALLTDVLRRIGAEVEMFVPSRYIEGYGVSAQTLKRLQDDGAALVITVDCGISNAKEITEARKAGLKVVVTDHHLPPAKLPEAEAVINPNLPGDSYPNKALTGVGVAFKLAQALLAESDLTPERKEAAEKWLLDLLAIGTVADLASLTGENRTLVKFGLVVMAKTHRPGLSALIRACSIEPTKLDTGHIGFAIAPRLNAAGRISDPQTALELLTTTDKVAGLRLAAKLTKLNTERQALTESALQEAKATLGAVSDERRALVVAGQWKSGIVGLIAGKLAQSYYRPALVIEKGEEYSTGSARSIPALNIVEALTANKKLLSAFGGHAAAAGFSLPTKNLEAFTEAIEAYCAERLSPEDLAPELIVETELACEDITFELLEQLENFAPFGIDNPRPLVQLSGVTVTGTEIVGRDETHLKCSLASPDGTPVQAIQFGGAEYRRHLSPGNLVDVVGSPVSESWNGTKRITFHVSDFRSA